MIRRLGGCLSLAAGIAAILFVRSVWTASDAVADTPREAVRVSEQPAKQSPGGVIAAFEEASGPDGTPLVVLHEPALRDAALQRGKVVLGRLPLGGGRFVTLDVAPLRVVGPQTRIVVGGPDGADVPVAYDVSDVHVFGGTVQGRPESSVVLVWSSRGIRGHIDLGPTDQRYTLSSADAAGQKLGPGLAVVRPVDRSAERLPDVPLCGTERTSVVAGCCPEPASNVVITKRLKAVEIAVETDFDLYENFNDLTAETDYIVEIFARTNAILMRDINVRFDVVFIRLFNNPAAEKPFMNNPDPLDGYVNYWNANMGGVARDTGTFLSGRRDLPYGGVAYLGAVCTSFGYCVCGYLSGFPDPTRPSAGDYDTGVVAHELGHNFNACHTPDYCPPVDRCYPPPTVPQRGTLMSYCSQTVSGGNLVTDLWYHTRLRRVMRDFIENGASCVSYDCNQNGIDDTVDISGGASADANHNGIPDECEDCNGNGVLDPTDIALGTSTDLNANGIPDDCEPDCNGNGVPDDRDIALGSSADVWGNGVPDECDPDCNGNHVADYNEIQADLSKDLDRNVVLDSCQDCDGNGINDLVQIMGARNAWVASDVLNYVGEYHAVSGARVLTSSIGQVNTAQDLIVAPGSRVLVSSAGNNKIIAYNAVSGAYLSDFVPAGSGGLNYPTGLVIGPNGQLFVSSRNTNSVLQYDGATGAFLGTFVTAGSGGLSSPFGLAFGPTGNLYVTSAGNQVLEYDAMTGAFSRVFVSAANNGGLSGARGMLFKPDGKLLVASYNTDALLQYDGATGAFLGKWNSGGTSSALYLDGPWGLRLGPTGNVFATRDLPANDELTGPPPGAIETDALHVTTARIMEFDIRNGKYVRSFIVGDDTGLRSPTGFDFMPGTVDCNFNMLPDNCDLASGTSLDANGNGVPDECDPTRPADDPSGVRKTRSLSLQVPPQATSGPAPLTALRVTLVELQNPQPPNADCCPPRDFSAYEAGPSCTDPGGCARWVGKPGTFLESQFDPGDGSYRAARLQCTPLYRDWNAEGVFHIIGAEIVPSSKYRVQNLAQSCQGSEATCVSVSASLLVTTARSGDVAAAFNPPATITQPDALDVLAVVNKFKSVLGSGSKVVTQLQPNALDPNADINALDILACVNAVKGLAYPFTGPCPCPSLVTCNAASCVGNGDCSGGLCVKTCLGGTNGGEPCNNNTHCPGGVCGTGFCRDACGRCTP